MLINTGKEIRDPKVDQVVFFQPYQSERDKDKKPYPVIINSGYYLDPQYQRLSNHWEWNRLTSTGKIGKKENGYGNFFKAEGYKVTRKVVILK